MKRKKGRSPFINTILNRPGEGGTAHEDDAPGKLLFKSRALGAADGKYAALLNAHHTTGSTGDEIILHTKNFKIKK
jgi:hypothetical protein